MQTDYPGVMPGFLDTGKGDLDARQVGMKHQPLRPEVPSQVVPNTKEQGISRSKQCYPLVPMRVEQVLETGQRAWVADFLSREVRKGSQMAASPDDNLGAVENGVHFRAQSLAKMNTEADDVELGIETGSG